MSDDKIDRSMRPIQQAFPGALAVLLRVAPLSPGKVSFAWSAAVGPALDRMTSEFARSIVSAILEAF
jgi:hypothetical protein